jgi:C4-dicarboxylate-specific signal transduction histidine kinase
MKTTFELLKISFIIIIIGLGGQVWAQTTTLKSEQAKLVSKFAKHITWPDDARQNKFIIGVYKDTEKYEYFRKYFENRSVKDKDILVTLINKFSEARDANILYLSSDERNSLTSANDNIRNSSILIITEDSKEPHKSMIDISYNKQKSKINFRINDTKINKQQLIIPELSALLNDEGTNDILPLSSTFIEKNKQEEKFLTLQKKLTQQEKTLIQLNTKLSLSNKNSEKYNLNLKKEVARLQLAQKEIADKSKQIEARDEQLTYLKKQLQAQIKINKQGLTATDEDIIKAEADEEAEKQKQLAQDNAIADLNESLEQQKKMTNNANLKLTNVINDNEALSSFKMLFYVCLFIAIIAFLIAIIMWKKAKNSLSNSSLNTKSESDTLLPIRNRQLAKSENLAALGYIATDTTYSVGLYLAQLQTQLESIGDTNNVATLKPVVTLLNNFNLIAADQDETKIQNFDVISYIQKMIMLYDFEFKQSDIAYIYSGEKTLAIKSVPSYIALILLNIINNSLKHGFDNNGKGKITLHVEKGVQSGAKITYSDDGKGMSKAILKKIFEPFFTTHSDRGYVGLGMSTVHNLIKDKLSGNIQIESQEGKGTTVIITLP